jgi:hypothetical protein
MELFTQKIFVTKLSKIWVWDPGSGKNLFRIPDPGVKKHRIPDPQHCNYRYILKQCCGSRMFIPDPNFFHPGSRILGQKDSGLDPDPHQKNCFHALGNMVRDLHPGSTILKIN